MSPPKEEASDLFWASYRTVLGGGGKEEEEEEEEEEEDEMRLISCDFILKSLILSVL